ncbi:MAG: hypothetical protein KC731_13570, partial [Myxococcales bacterium]|nr:hypothetical protein [Myxococcales bacterium]
AVVLLVIATTPRRLWSRHTTVSILLTEASVIALYTTRDLVAVALFWLLSGIPGLASLRQLDRDKSRPQPRARLVCGLPLTGSGLLVAVAVGMQVMQAQELGVSQPTSVAALQGLGTSKVVFALLMVAVLLRKGVIPFHSWLPPLFERGPLGLVMVLFNAHLGAFLVARVIIPVFGEMSAAAATVVTAIALLTAVYAAMVASAQSDPRRLLGFVSMSQASFLLVGLESFNHEGVAGALVLWISLGLASTAAVMAYRALEARAGRRTLKTYHGLAARMPRLAASFVIFGLAMAGLPGTLGFAAEDLLVHGVLESHPAIGVLLVLAAGLNAVNVLRMFMRMFLGRPLNQVAAYPDLSRREGWALALVLLFVVVTGILPHGMVLLREQAASSIAAHRPSMELAMERTTAEVPQ